MASGTADKAKISDILDNDVLFPTESLANANIENENNNSDSNENNNNIDSNDDNNEEEEEYYDNIRIPLLIKQNEESSIDKNPSNEDNQQQISSQQPNDNKDEIQNEQQDVNVPKEEDVNTISEQFLSGEKVVTNDPTLLAYVVSNLEEKRDQLMMDGDFRNSIATQKAVDAARSKQFEAVKKKASKEELGKIRKKQKKLESKYKEFEEQMNMQEEQLENEINYQIQIMEEHHRKQIQDHDQSWQNESKQRQYNRASQRLRVLRTQQQLLMNAKRFDEAEHVCKIADGVAQQEALESYKQMLTAYKNSRRILEEKQQEEMDMLMTSSEQKREIFQHQKEVLTQPFIKRINNLNREREIAKDPERLLTLKYRNDEKKLKSYNGNARDTQTAQPQAENQDQSQDQSQNQTQTRNQNKNLGHTQYQYQEKKKTMPDYNKLDLPPLFGPNAPAASQKKGKSTKKANKKTNDTNQNEITSNQTPDVSIQKNDQKDADLSTQNANPSTKKSKVKHPRKTNNLNAE